MPMLARLEVEGVEECELLAETEWELLLRVVATEFTELTEEEPWRVWRRVWCEE